MRITKLMTCRSSGPGRMAAWAVVALLGAGTAEGADLEWDANTGTVGAQDGAGNWNTSANNWWTGSANALWNNGTPDTAYIGAANAAGATITVASGMSAAALNLRAPGSGSYTLSGGDLTLGAGGLSTLRLGPVLALDRLSVGAAGAYSLRKLRSAYAGFAVRVRRSSDSVEQDIGFDANGNLDSTALTAFLGGATAYVRTWYDQSTNARHGQQATAANQPLLSVVDGRWTLTGDGTDYFTASTATVGNMTAGGASGTAVLVVRTSNLQQMNFGYTGTGRWSAHLNWNDGSSTLYFDAGGTTAGNGRISIANSGNNGVWQQYTLWRSGANKSIRWGGVERLAAAGAIQTASTTGGWEVMGCSGDGSKARSMTSEYIQFASGLSAADLLVLEYSQSAYWGVPGPALTATVSTPIALGVAQSWDVGTGHTVTVGGAISGAGHALTINGTSGLSNSGTLVLGGNSGFTGITTIKRGTVALAHASALGATGAGNATTVNGNDGNTATTLSLSPASAGLAIAETLNLNASGAGRVALLNNSAQNHTLSGPIDVSSTGSLVQFDSAGTGSITVTGDIAGTMSGGSYLFLRGTGTSGSNRLLGSVNLVGGNLSKTDAGTWLVGATGKTYSWVNTQVAVGTLTMGVANVLPATTTLTMGQGDANNATLNLNGFGQTIASLVLSSSGGTKTITSATTAILTLNNAGANSYGGTLNGVGLGLTKNGAGTLTLSGNAIDYQGPTTVTEGRLILSNNDDTHTSALAISSGATVEIYRDTAAVYEHQKTIVISGAGTLEKTGTGIVEMNANVDSTISLDSGAKIDVKAGTLRLGYGTRSNWANNKADLNIEAGATFDQWDKNATPVIVDALTGGGTYIKGTAVDYGDGNLTVGVDNGSGNFTGSLRNGTGSTPGVLSFTKTGTGAQTLSGANTYTGMTTVEGGTLTVNGSLANASMTITGGAVNGGGTLDYRIAGNTADRISLSGSGAIDISGFTLNVVVIGAFAEAEYVVIDDVSRMTGTFAAVNLPVPSTYWSLDYDGTDANPGAVVLVYDAASALAIWDGETDGSWAAGQNWLATTPINNVPLVFPAAALNKANNNDLLTSVMSLALEGGYTIGGNALALGNSVTSTGDNTISLPLSLALGGRPFDVQNTLIYSGSASGAGGIAKFSSGTLVVNGVNSYSGPTTINGGILKLAAPPTTAPGSLSGLTIHLDATQLAQADGSVVGTWGNLGSLGASGNFTRSGTATQPTFHTTRYLLNGRPQVKFYASDLLRNTSNHGNTCTVMFAGRLEGGVQQRLVGGGNNHNWLLGFHGGTQDDAHFNAWLYNGAPSVDYLGKVYEATFDAGTAAFYRNGTLLAGPTAGFQGPNGLALGGYYTTVNAEPSNGSIGELLVFNRVLSDTERQQMEAYLQAKWYGPLPAASAVTVTGGILDLDGVNQTIGSLAGDASGQVRLNGGWLTVGNPTTTTTFSGTIVNGTAAGGGLFKDGLGDLILAGGSANTFTGDTVLRYGRLGLSKTAGAAFGGNFIGIHNLSPDVYTTQDNQFPPGCVMVFVGDAGDHVRFELLGTSQTLAGIDNAGGRSGYGVIQQYEQSGQASVDGLSTLILNGSGTYSFDGYLRDSGGKLELIKSGTGTQTLSGVNITFTGQTTVNGGQLTFTGTAYSGTAGSLVADGATLLMDSSENNRLRGPLTVSGTLNVINTAAHTLGGDIVLNTGVIDTGSAVGTGGRNEQYGVLYIGGANRTVTASGAGNTVSGSNNTFGLETGRTLFFHTPLATDALLVSGRIVRRSDQGTSTGAVTKTGEGTLTLSGANTYLGATTVSAGRLLYGASDVILSGALTVNGVTAVLDLATYSDTVGTVTLQGGGTLTGTSGILASTAAYEMQSGTVSAILGGTMGLNKTTAGTVTLASGVAQQYTGATAISAGTLLVNGSLDANSAVTISGTGVLGGTGAANGTLAVNSGGTVAPGTSVGQLNAGATTFAAGGAYRVELGSVSGTPGTDWDHLNIVGALVMDAAFTVDVRGDTITNWDPAGNYTWTIATASGGISGSLPAISTANFGNGFNGVFSLSTVGNELRLTYTAGTGPVSLFWDLNGAAAGAGSATPDGDWNAADTDWGYSGAGIASTFPWQSGNIGVFSAGTDATGEYTITVGGGGITANGITFEDGTPTVTGGTLTLAGTTPTITSRSSLSPLLSAPLAGSAGLNINLAAVSGANLYLEGNNGYSGGTTFTGNNGYLGIAHANALGTGNALTMTDSTGWVQLGLHGVSLAVGDLTGSANSFIQNSADGTLQTLTVNQTGSTTFAGILRNGSGLSDAKLALVKTGGGPLTLTGANAFTGGTAIDQGQVIIGAGGALANQAVATIAVNNGGTLTFSRTDTFGNHAATIVTPIVLNAGGVVNNNGAYFNCLGPIILNGGSVDAVGGVSTSWASFGLKGDVTVMAGSTSTMSSGGANAGYHLGNAGVTGTTFDVGSGGLLQLTGTLVDGRATASPYNPQVSFLNKTGSGTLTLSGDNTYTGGTIIRGGVLSVEAIADGALSNIGRAGGTGNYIGMIDGTLRYTGTGAATTTRSLWVDQAQTGSTFDIVSPTGSLTINSAGSNRINKNITKTGAGTLTLGPAVADGIYQTAAVTVNQGTLVLTGTRIDHTGATVVNAGTTLRMVNLDDCHSVSLYIAPGATAEFSIAGTFNRFSATSIEGSGTFVKSGAGTLRTGNATDQYAKWNMTGGLIDVQAGTFLTDYQNQSVAWVNNKASMNVAAPAFVSMSGGNHISVDALTGAGTVQNVNNWGTGIFTVGQNDGSGAFSGLLRDNGGPLALTKVGSGSQTLTGASTYSGATTIAGGTLLLDFSAGGAAGSNILPSGTALVLVGGALEVKGTAGQNGTVQTVGGTTVNSPSTLKLTPNGATTADVNLGALTLNSGAGVNFVGATGSDAGARFITTSSAGLNDGQTRLPNNCTWNGTGWASIKDVGGVKYVVQWEGVYTDIATGTDTGYSVVVPDGSTESVRILEGGLTGAPNRLELATTTIGSLLMTAATTPSAIRMNVHGANDTLVIGGGAGASGAVTVGAGAQGLTIGQSGNQGYVTVGTSGASTLSLSANNADAGRGITVNSRIQNNAGGGLVSLSVAGGGVGGTIVLAGANSFTGPISIGDGVLRLAGAGSLGLGSYGETIVNNGTLRYSSSVAQTLSGVIGGTGDLIKDTDASVLTLSGANTYSGATTVNAGTIRLLRGTATASAFTLNAGGTLRVDNDGATWTLNPGPTVSLNGGTLAYYTSGDFWTVLSNRAITSEPATSSFITLEDAGGATIAGFFPDAGLKGSGTVTVNPLSAGVALNLRNNNTTFSGLLIVNGIASATAGAGSGLGVGGCTIGLQNADIELNGTMELLNGGIGYHNPASGQFWMGALSGTGVMVGNYRSTGGGTTVTLGWNDHDGDFAGTIANGTDNTVNIVKVGTGTQTFSGASTYTGTTTINGGILQAGASACVFGTNSAVTLANTPGVSLDLNNLDVPIGSLAGGGASGGNVLLGTGTLTVGGNNGNTTYSGVLSGNGALVKVGTGILSLVGVNTFAGGSTVNAGQLQIRHNNALAGAVTVNAGGVLSLGQSGLSVNTDITLNGGLFSGGMDSGTVNNTYGGTIALTALGGTVTTWWSDKTVTLTGKVTGPGALTVDVQQSGNNGGRVIMAGSLSNDYAGTTTLRGGTAGDSPQLGLAKSGGAVAIPGDMIMAATGTRAILWATHDNQFGPNSVLRWVGSGDTRFELKGTTQMLAGIDTTGYVPGTYATVQHSEFGSPAVVDSTSHLILNVPVGQSYTFGGANTSVRDYNGGVLSLTKNGSGTQTLDGGGITYSGATALNAGTLALRDTTGFASYMTMDPGATLNLARTVVGFGNRNRVTRFITGAGTINVNAADNSPGATDGGWVTFLTGSESGLDNFTGTVNVNTGNLSIDNGGRWLGNPTLNVYNNGFFGIRNNNISVDGLNGDGHVGNDFNGDTVGHTLTVGANNGSGLFSGVIHGSVNGGSDNGGINEGILHLNKAGSGTQTLTGINTYGGSTTVSGGTLKIGGAGQLKAGNYSGAVAISTGAVFEYNSSAAQSLTGSLTGSGEFRVTGAGAVTLGGVGAYNGALTVSTGRLNLNGTVGAAALSVASDATLGGEGSLAAGSSLTLADGANLVINPTTDTGALSVGNLDVSAGTVTVHLDPPRTTSGDITVRVLNYSGTRTGDETNFAIAGTGYRKAEFDVSTPGQVNLTYNLGGLTWTGANGSEWDIDTTANWTPQPTFFNGDQVTFADNVANRNIVLGVSVEPSEVIFSYPATYAYSLSGAGGIDGSARLQKLGTGTLTINTDNSFSGGATLGYETANGGAIVLGHANALGTGTITMKGGQVQAGAAGLTITNAITVAGGGFRFGGAHDLTFSGLTTLVTANRAIGNYSGVKTLTLGDIATGGYVATFEANDGAENNGAIVVNGAITGTGGVRVHPSFDNSVVTLNAANSYSGATAVEAGTLTFSATSGHSGMGAITVGGGGGSARLNLGGAVASSGTQNTIVGSAASDRGTLTIGADATFYKMLVGNNATASGAVIQNGVNVVIGSGLSNVDVLSLGLATGGYGYYRMNGGTLLTGQLGLAGNTTNAKGVFDLLGGTVTVNGGWVVFGWGTGQNGVLNIHGGTLTSPAANPFTLGFAGSGYANVNVLGGTLDTTANAYMELSRTGVNESYVNIAGGTLFTKRIASAQTSGTRVLTFNGGTLKAGAASTTFLPAALTGAYVYGGGATIDTAGYSITVAQPLLAPTGNGVTAIPVSTPGAGYTGAPVVRLTGGGGTGATAIAQVDLTDGSPTYGQVTGILVTSAGYDYTSAPTVTLIGGGATSEATPGTPTLGANASGGLTKISAGTLTLAYNYGSFTGGTTISTGTVASNPTSDTNNQLNSPLGARIPGNVITVEDGAVLTTTGTQHNWIDGVSMANDGSAAHTVVINTGGKVSNAAGYITGIGNLTLNGGTLECNNGYAAGWSAAYVLLGDVTVGGATTSSITKPGTTVPDIRLTTANASRTFTVGGGSSLHVATPLINGNGFTSGLIKAGPGAMTLTAANTFSGNTVVEDGVVTLGAGGTLANTASLTIETGTTLNLSGAANNQIQASAVSPTLTINGTLRATTALAHTLYATTITMNNGTLDSTGGVTTDWGAFFVVASRTITANGAGNVIGGNGRLGINGGQTLTLDTPLAGDAVLVSTILGYGASGTAGGLIKSGAGTATLSSANTYTGTTTVQAGTLTLGPGGSLGHANITISGGALNGTGSTLNYRLVNDTGNLIAISGSGAMNATGIALNLVVSGRQTAGEYVLADDNTRFTGPFASVAAPAGWSVDYDGTTANPGAVVLVFDASAVSATWDGEDAGNDLWTSGLNWQGDATPVEGAPLIFPVAAGEKSNINNLLGAVYSLSLAGGYTLSGNPLALANSVNSTGNNTIALPLSVAGTRTLEVQSGTLTVAGAISGAGGVAKVGAGTLTFNGVNTYTGATTVAVGTLKLQSSVGTLPVTGGLVARWDATAITGLADGATVDTWTDLSPSARNLTRTAGAPVYVTNGGNGLPIVRFTSDGNSYFSFTGLTTIRSVFYVARELESAADRNFWLGHDISYHFHRGEDANAYIWGANSSANIRNGVTRLNGVTVNGAATPFGTGALKLLSVVTTGNVEANRVSYDRGIAARSWRGDIGEILIYDRALAAEERLQVEQYLMRKWLGTAPPTTSLALSDAGSRLDLNGVRAAIGSLAGVAGSQVLLNGGVLTVGNNNRTTTMSGIFADGSVAGGGFTKDGTGDLILAGNASNTHTGPTLLQAGRIGLAKTGGAYAFPGHFIGIHNWSPDVYATVDNQFPPGSVMYFRGNSGDQVRFELLGTTQTLAGIDNSGGRSGAGVVQHREQVTAAAVDGVSTLILNGSGSYFYDGSLRDTGGQLELIKNGTGTQTLSGVNSYTGDTTVLAGTLAIAGGSSLADGAALRISTGAKVEVAFGVVETVNEIYIDGRRKWPGTWGAPGSGAQHVYPAYFAGQGVVNVLNGDPIPPTIFIIR